MFLGIEQGQLFISHLIFFTLWWYKRCWKNARAVDLHYLLPLALVILERSFGSGVRMMDMPEKLNCQLLRKRPDCGPFITSLDSY